MTSQFLRFTAAPEADAGRIWSYRPCDIANAVLATRALTDEEMDAAIDSLREDDRAAATSLADAVDNGLEWTGQCWATRQSGIPGFEVGGDAEAEARSYAATLGALVSAVPGAVAALYDGEWAGDEYETTVSTGAACTFIPCRLVQVLFVVEA